MLNLDKFGTHVQPLKTASCPRTSQGFPNQWRLKANFQGDRQQHREDIQPIVDTHSDGNFLDFPMKSIGLMSDTYGNQWISVELYQIFWRNMKTIENN